MKNNSVIGLVLITSIIASIFWAALTTKIFTKWSVIENNITWKEILSLQKEIQNIKSDKNNQIGNKSNSNQISNLENNIIDIAKNASTWVVSIIIKKDLAIYKSDPWGFFKQKIWTIKQKVWWWTGFFVTKDWKIITNKHVVSDKNAEYTIITKSWNELIWKVIAIDPSSDLAIMQIESNSWETIKTTPLNFIKNENEIKIGQFAIAIWNKLWELENSVSFWLVSWKDRTIKTNNINLSNLIQTDAEIHPWNSWWPLLNLKWEVIWINTFTINQNKNIWLAIQLSEKNITYILDSIKKYWKIIRPFLWINYISNSKMIQDKFKLRSDKWVYILNETWAIAIWSSAKKVWIMPWDIITQIDDTILSSKNSLNSIIQWKIPWDKVKLKIIKPSWEIKRLKITL